jgi:hypothetical protein
MHYLMPLPATSARLPPDRGRTPLRRRCSGRCAGPTGAARGNRSRRRAAQIAPANPGAAAQRRKRPSARPSRTRSGFRALPPVDCTTCAQRPRCIDSCNSPRPAAHRARMRITGSRQACCASIEPRSLGRSSNYPPHPIARLGKARASAPEIVQRWRRLPLTARAHRARMPHHVQRAVHVDHRHQERPHRQ